MSKPSIIVFGEGNPLEYFNTLLANYVLVSALGDYALKTDLNQYVLGEEFTIRTKKTAWKSHRESRLEFRDTEWTTISFDLVVEDECLDGISFDGISDSVLKIEGFDDIFYVGGCIHTTWEGDRGQSCKVLSRVLYSEDNENWTEARCLQTNTIEDRGINAEGTQNFSGSIYVSGTTYVKLQVKVSNTDMVLEGDEDFEHPVSATLSLFNIGNNKEV